MSTFPETSFTLIAKIKDLARGQDSAVWNRFWDLYAPAMRAFAVFKGARENADDVVMTVLAKLVEVLRSGQYQPEKGRFHSYLATMIYNEVHMLRRKDEVRKSESHVPFDEVLQETLAAPGQVEEVAADADWQRAILAAAMEHVLTRTALSERDREVYRFYVMEGRSLDEASAHFKLARNNISQIKTRIEKRIAAIGREMAAAAERL
jgi:RNA polymerase sigma factor (sigma-70 family)